MSERIKRLPSRQLIRTLSDQRAELEHQRAPQPIGGDILQVQSIPDVGVSLAGPLNLGANGVGDFTIITIPNGNTLTLWNFLWSLYVDPFFNGALPDATNRWPDGAALTSQQINTNVTGFIDWATSSDRTNERTYKIHLHNNDTAAHTYYVAFKAYFPYLNQ